MKAKELSLLIVDDDQIKRQLLASLVSDRYRSVTVTAPQDAGSLMALKSFDVIVAPRIGMSLFADDDGDSRIPGGVTSVAVIRSSVSGNLYEFRSINQESSSCVTNPFERVLIQVAIEKSELFLEKLKRINENGAGV